ncbi:response regulator [Propionivibrio sp.]|uniref:response regulator n=1 Tax=Propionivibrio sp. TaxID=2212460 RepID=UPI003BF00AA3
MKLRVLLADDHMLFRTALRMVLELAPDIEVVGEAADGLSVLKAVGECNPDVVCMDLSMPNLDGIEATRQLLAIYPQVKVIGLSAHVEPQRVAQMINAGALGYVLKMDVGSELLPAIRSVSRNQTYLSTELGLQGVTDLAKYAMQVGDAGQ